jgi:hypothetical protein
LSEQVSISPVPVSAEKFSDNFLFRVMDEILSKNYRLKIIRQIRMDTILGLICFQVLLTQIIYLTFFKLCLYINHGRKLLIKSTPGVAPPARVRLPRRRQALDLVAGLQGQNQVLGKGELSVFRRQCFRS